VGGAVGVILGVYGQVALKEKQPMALSQSVLSELLDAFRAGEGVDLVRDAVRLVMQELIEVQATEAIGDRGGRRASEPCHSRRILGSRTA
jgi:putative transposase